MFLTGKLNKIGPKMVSQVISVSFTVIVLFLFVFGINFFIIEFATSFLQKMERLLTTYQNYFTQKLKKKSSFLIPIVISKITVVNVLGSILFNFIH